MKIGYLRVSTEEQRPDRQIDALKHICDALHVERLSATAKCRPVYQSVVAGMKSGDIFVILDLDRAYRSAKDALVELDALRERGIEIQIVSLNVDTSTPHGKLLYTFVSGLAEFERALLSERTKQGLAAARRRGQRLGRPPKLTKRQIATAVRKLKSGNYFIKDVAEELGVHPWTLSRSIRRVEKATGPS